MQHSPGTGIHLDVFPVGREERLVFFGVEFRGIWNKRCRHVPENVCANHCAQRAHNTSGKRLLFCAGCDHKLAKRAALCLLFLLE